MATKRKTLTDKLLVKKTPRKKNPETILCNAIKEALNKLPGVKCYRNSVMSGFMKSGRFASAGLGKGSSDFVVCAKGKFLGLEVKVPGKKADEHQEKWGEELRVAGGVYEVCTSVEDALAVVKRMVKEGV